MFHKRRAASFRSRLSIFRGGFGVVRFRLSSLVIALLLFVSSLVAVAQKPRTPSDTVREFYKAMHEKRFREAFDLSIYKPAIEGLKQHELDDLRADFDNMAAAIPQTIEVNGEQISGDTATVFVKVPDDDGNPKLEPVTLIQSNGEWIIGDKQNQAIVDKAGNSFFFNARIVAHQNDVTDMLQKISVAELVYSQKHNGQFGDLAALINAGLIPKDIEGSETTGYRFRVNLGKDAKSFTANAEPAQYGRTGKLSFVLDQTGIRSGDNGGKPLNIK
jgi:hypothetical protein